MPTQNLPIGTIVIFALGPDLYPAWFPPYTNLTCCMISKISILGIGYIIDSRDPHTIRVLYEHPQDGALKWSWPLPGHDDYNETLANTILYPQPKENRSL